MSTFSGKESTIPGKQVNLCSKQSQLNPNRNGIVNFESKNRVNLFQEKTFTLNGRTKVKTLKANFKENFGATLRVYKSATCKGAFADDDATLASIRAEGAKGGELVVKGNMQVGNFEKKVAELYGIGVQVATADDSKLADNGITLVAAGK